MRTIFNPLANISAAETKKQQTNSKTNKKSKLHDGLSKSLNAISGSSTRDDKKQFKAFPNKKNSCWACKNDHKRMICDEFLNKDVFDCKQFVIDQKVYFKFLSKNHHVKDRISEFTGRHESCGKKHHTLLYEDKKPMASSPANPRNVSTVQTALQQSSINTDEAQIYL